MTWIPVDAKRQEIINVLIISSLGVLSVTWVTMIIDDMASLYSYRNIVLLTSLTGITLGLLPWGFLASETLWARILLLYLTSTFLTASVAITNASLATSQFLGGTAVVALLSGGIYYQFGGDDHRLFVPMWLCLLGVYLFGLVGLGRALLMIENMFPLMISVGATAIVVGTHRALIRERSRYISSG